MNKFKPISKRLDEQDKKLDTISKHLKTINQSNNFSKEIEHINAKKSVNSFIETSTKEYFWTGSKKDFNKRKKILIILNISLITSLLLTFLFLILSKGDEVYIMFLLNFISLVYLKKLIYAFKIKKTI